MNWKFVVASVATVVLGVLAGLVGWQIAPALSMLDIDWTKINLMLQCAQCTGLFVVLVVVFGIFVILPKPQSK